MARHSVRVTKQKSTNRKLPAWTAEYALLIETLRRNGVLARVEQRLRLDRRPGYAGIDLFLYLLAWFTYPAQIGLRPFSERVREIGPQLAALAHRASWPTSASVSRALKAVTADQAQEFTRWLLIEAMGVETLARAPVAITRDRRSRHWHLFDYDPTVTAMRQRALPRGDDLPDAKRRTDALAAPGYSGRKRGEVQYNRTPLQHAGTSLWLWQSLSAGNGHHIDELESAAAAVAAFCAKIKVELHRAVIRFDGGIGGVRALLACRSEGVTYLTRIARYNLLQLAPVAQHLETAQWYTVKDSGSGPKREATELGNFTLAAKDSRHQHIETRVVVSRFRAQQGRKQGAGIVLDGWHYELFATDLPADGWPAAETVTAYYGRCGQENRYSQEDKELDLDRTFSFNPAGQLVATTIGLFLWNLRLCMGAELTGVTSTSPLVGTNQPKASTATAECSDERQDIEQENSPAQPAATCTQEVLQWLATLDWPVLLARQHGWRWDDQLCVLMCPNDAALNFHGLADSSPKSVTIRFRARRSDCQLCPIRGQCTHSSSHHFRKEIGFAVDRDLCTGVEAIESRLQPLPAAHNDHHPVAPSVPQPPLWIPPSSPTSGPFGIRPAMLLPAVLRSHFLAACRSTRVSLTVHRPQPVAETPAFLAPTARERQHRRQSWRRRQSLNALESKARVCVHLEVPSPLQKTLSRKRLKNAATARRQR